MTGGAAVGQRRRVSCSGAATDAWPDSSAAPREVTTHVCFWHLSGPSQECFEGGGGGDGLGDGGGGGRNEEEKENWKAGEKVDKEGGGDEGEIDDGLQYNKRICRRWWC